MSRAAAQVLSVIVTVGPDDLIASYNFAGSSRRNGSALTVLERRTQLAFVNCLSTAPGKVRTGLYASHLTLLAKCNPASVSRSRRRIVLISDTVSTPFRNFLQNFFAESQKRERENFGGRAARTTPGSVSGRGRFHITPRPRIMSSAYNIYCVKWIASH